MNNVNAVSVINPPMITTAKGRAVSAPTPVERAMGSNPSMAIKAVITMGRTREAAPPLIASIIPMLSPRSSADARDKNHAILDGDTEEGHKSDQRRDRKIETG